jgi:hypothetical protein
MKNSSPGSRGREIEAEGYSPAKAQERSGEDILRNFQGPFMLFMVMFRMLFAWRPARFRQPGIPGLPWHLFLSS